MLLTTKIKVISAVLILIGAFIAGMKLGSTTEIVEKEVKGETIP